jgi:hypothetical protein
VVVKEVSVTDVDYNSSSSNSCIFQCCEAVVDSGGDGSKFSGRHTTIVCGWFLLAKERSSEGGLRCVCFFYTSGDMRRYRLVRFDKIEEIK